MRKTNNFFILLIFLFLNTTIFYLNAGNIAFIQKGIINSGGKISLIDSSTTIFLDYDDKIKNHIYLNGGTASLINDVTFWGPYFFQDTGIVSLNARELNLGAHQYTLTSTLYFDGGRYGVGVVNVNSFTKLDSTWTFSKCCMLNGNGNTLDISSGQINIERGSMLKIKDIRIIGLHDENLKNLDDNAHLMLENVTFDLVDDFEFNSGSYEINSFFNINGPHSFYYDTTKTITIHKNTTYELSKDITFAIRTKKPSGGNKPIYFVDKSSELRIDTSRLEIGSAGLILTKGTMGIHGSVDLELNSTDTTNGFQIGNGTQSGNFYTVFYPASTMIVHEGYFVIDCTDADAMKSLSGFSKLKRLAGNIFYIKNNFNMNNLSVYVDSATKMITLDNIIARYINSKFMFDGVKFATTSSRYSDAVLLLSGDNYIFIQEGVLPLYSMVSGTGNKISGSGSYQGQIIMANSSAEVSLGLDGQFLNKIILNNGKVILDRDLEFFGDKFFSGNGTVKIDDNTLNLGSTKQVIDSEIYWDSSNGKIALNSDIKLENKWTFSGSCTLDGKGHILDLTNSGTLYVDRGSILTLKNINIYGIKFENVACSDDSGLIILDNCIYTLIDDFYYKQGGCKIYNNVELSGEHDFYLDTNSTMSVYNHSTFNLNNNITVKLRTVNHAAGRKPIWFEEKSSKFKAENATIILGESGAIFKRGTMSIYGDVLFELNSTDTTNGLQVGDGTKDGDFNIILQPASEFKVGAGDFVVDCYDSNSLRSLSAFSKFVRYSGNNFYIKNDFNISNVTIKIDMNTTMETPDNVNVTFSDCIFDLIGIKFITSSKRFSDGVLKLEGNDYISIQEGKMPFYLVVAGLNNRVQGNGSMQGAITLLDSSSAVDISLDGQVLNSIKLNGGKCSLSKDANFGQGVQLTTTGTLELGSSNINMGTLDINATSTLYIDSVQGSIDLNSSLTLSSCWTFSGDCTLNGNNNILQLEPTAQIIVETGSTLRLINLRIIDLDGNKISCFDDTGTLFVKNCEAILSGNYLFDKGRLIIDYGFDIRGSSTFIYSTSKQSIIHKDAKFNFFDGTTFSYAPSIPNRDLIYLDSNNSTISLNNASLHSTATGMQLTRGTLEARGLSYISSDAVCKEEGIILGDGSNENNNINIDIIAGATLDLISGHMIYRNVN